MFRSKSGFSLFEVLAFSGLFLAIGLSIGVASTVLFQRRSSTTPPAAYTARIVNVLNVQKVKGRDYYYVKATLEFDREVPNDKVTMIFDWKNDKVRLHLLRRYEDDAGKRMQWGQPTKRLDIALEEGSPFRDQINDLIGMAVRLYAHDWPPEMFKPSH